MFAEIALTPQVFDEHSNTDKDLWLESLYELGRGIFPRIAACPVIISDLYGGGWCDLVKNNLDDIVDHRVKRRVMEIYQQMKNYLSKRPSELSWPDDEEGWVKEINCSHGKEAFSRIMLSDVCFQGYVSDGKPVHSINHANEERSGFWDCIRSDGDVEMDINKQISLLRPICLHADYMALRTTYVAGGDDDETAFVATLIESACNRPSGYHELAFFELHLDGSRIENFDTVTHNIVEKIRECLSKHVELRVYYWPHFTDRELVAGHFSDGKKYQRWGISFNHIARPIDRSGSTRWHIIRQRDLENIMVDTASDRIIRQFSIVV